MRQLNEMIQVLPVNRDNNQFSYKMMLTLMYTFNVATELLTCHPAELIKHRAEQRADKARV